MLEDYFFQNMLLVEFTALTKFIGRIFYIWVNSYQHIRLGGSLALPRYQHSPPLRALCVSAVNGRNRFWASPRSVPPHPSRVFSSIHSWIKADALGLCQRIEFRGLVFIQEILTTGLRSNMGSLTSCNGSSKSVRSCSSQNRGNFRIESVSGSWG
jgi:hypothetical protein